MTLAAATSSGSLRGRTVLWVLALAVGCHGKSAKPEAQPAKEVEAITSVQVTNARTAGYLPSLVPPYAAIELLDDPVSVSSSLAPCISGEAGGRLINNSGVVIGNDCRQAKHFWMTGWPGAPLYTDPSSVGPLSSSVINHAPTYALPLPSGAVAGYPAIINDDGVVYGITLGSAWGPRAIWKADHTLWMPSPLPPFSPPSVAPWLPEVGSFSSGTSPVILGTGQNGSTQSWFTLDTAATTTPTFLAAPTGFPAGEMSSANTRGDVVGSYTKSDNSVWAETNESGQWYDISARVQGTNPFDHIENLKSVNDNRQAVGYGLEAGSTSSVWRRHAVKVDLYTHNVTDLGLIPGGWDGPTLSMDAKGINAKGHVVGAQMAGPTFTDPGIYPWYHAFTWSFEWGLRDLNAYLDPSLGITTTTAAIGDAYAVNDNDEIVGLHVTNIPGTPVAYRMFRMKVDFNRGGPEFYEPTNGQRCSLATGINNSGQVTGWSDTGPGTGVADSCQSPWASTNQVFPFATTTNGVPLQLGALTGASIYPTAINSGGYVGATAYYSATDTNKPVLYHAANWTVAEQPSVFTNAANATALNNIADANGGPVLVGGETVPSAGQTWYSYQNGQKTLLSQLSGSTGGAPLAVADDGTMVGYFTPTGGGRVAAAWVGGAMIDLNTRLASGSGWTLTMALGLNNGHWAVGFGMKGSSRRAFKMNLADGTIFDVGTLESPNNTLPINANAINSLGHVVGTVGTLPSGDTIGANLVGTRAFFYADDSGITDINAIVDMPPGWVLAAATGINDSDEIVGYAVQTATGIRRGYKARIPALPSSDCTNRVNGAACNDLNHCTLNDSCQNGVCVGSSPVTCPGAPDQCHQAGVCQPATGACTFANVANGTTCSDNSLCTSGDRCVNGACIPVTTVTCAASDQCHVAGTCSAATGVCSNPTKADGTACNDSNACTQTDTCNAGICIGGNPVTCVASDGCHAAGTCAPNSGACSTPQKAGGSCWISPAGGGKPGVGVTEPPDASGSGLTCSQPLGINDSGEVVAFASRCTDPTWPDTQPAEPFTILNNVTHALPVPEAGASVFPTGVSSSGHVVANVYNPTTGKRSVYLYRAESTDQPELMPFPPAGGAAWTIHTDIFAGTLSTIAGAGAGLGPTPWQWTSYDIPPAGSPPGPVVAYPPAPGLTDNGAAFGMNNNGYLVGYYSVQGAGISAAFENGNSAVRDLNPVFAGNGPNMTLRAAFAINDSNDVVGYGVSGIGHYAFKGNLDSRQAIALDPLPNPLYASLAMSATAINNMGIAVGTAGLEDSTGLHLTPERAFVYSSASNTIDMNDLFSLSPNWVLASAVGINNNNQVTGAAMNTLTNERVTYVVTLPNVVSAECLYRADGTSCNDGDPCTQTAQCVAGTCTRTAAVTCVAQDPCHVAGVCDSALGGCTNPPANDGATCQDGNACTTGDTCQAGTCIGGPSVTCTAMDACHFAGACDPATGQCSNPTEIPAPPSLCSSPGSCFYTPPDACSPQPNIDWSMQPHFVGSDSPPADTFTCPDGLRKCLTPDLAEGCQTVTLAQVGTDEGAQGDKSLDPLYGPCMSSCHVGDITACTYNEWYTGIHTCRANGTWEPCQPFDPCNGIDDDEDNTGPVADQHIDNVPDANGNYSDVSTCVKPISLWDPTHARGFDTVLSGCASTPPTLPASSPIVEWDWTIAGEGPSIVSHTCAARHTFKNEGAYATTLRVVTADGRSSTTSGTISIKNNLIVSAGDSIASGEGNPDVLATEPLGPQWQDVRCDRSLKSWHALVSKQLEEADPHSSVSFFPVACSGAGISSGIIGEYDGENKPSGPHALLPAQAVTIENVLQGAHMDALLLQIGANDVGFRDHVVKCAYPPLHFPGPLDLGIAAGALAESGDFSGAEALGFIIGMEEGNPAIQNTDLTLAGCENLDQVKAQMACLSARYCRMQHTVFANPVDCDDSDIGSSTCPPFELKSPATKFNVDPSRVYIAEYPDPTHAAPGQICQEVVLPGAVLDSVGPYITPTLFLEAVGATAVLALVPEFGFISDALTDAEVLAAVTAIVNASDLSPDAHLDQERLTWAYNNIIVPLNNHVQSAATQMSWSFIDGINQSTDTEDGFDKHGLCAADHWHRQWDESKRLQSNTNGVFHPTYYPDHPLDSGHGHYADRLYSRLSRDLLAQ